MYRVRHRIFICWSMLVFIFCLSSSAVQIAHPNIDGQARAINLTRHCVDLVLVARTEDGGEDASPKSSISKRSAASPMRLMSKQSLRSIPVCLAFCGLRHSQWNSHAVGCDIAGSCCQCNMGMEQLRAEESEEAQQQRQVAKTTWREGKENSLHDDRNSL